MSRLQLLNYLGVAIHLLLFASPFVASAGEVGVDGNSVFIVHLSGDFPPAVAYEGGIRGFTATAPTPAAGIRSRLRPRLDSQASHVRAYVFFLRQLHKDIATSVGLLHGDILYSYEIVLNGFAARLSTPVLARLRAHPLVAWVEPSTTYKTTMNRAPQFLKLDTSIWPTLGGSSNAGAGVVVGIIDTGIWPENPFFSETDYTSASPPSTWKGKCNTTSDFPASSCNKKLIGANYFYAGATSGITGGIDTTSDWLSPRDAQGHGSWCASAATGSSATPVTINSVSYGIASGTAPRAFLAAYKVFWTFSKGLSKGQSLASTPDIIAAVNQGVADGVDVLSLSLGAAGVTDYYSSGTDVALLGATKAGVFVSCTAGNEGPPPSTRQTSSKVGNIGPHYLSVGASTIDRKVFATITYDTTKTIDVPEVIPMPAASTSPFIAASSCALAGVNTTQAQLCFNSTLDSSKCNGKIVLCDRGENTFVEKINNVKAAGGVAIIVTNVAGGRTDQVELGAYVDGVTGAHVLEADGKVLKQYISSAALPTVSISAAQTSLGAEAPYVADFSSRGPPVNPKKLLGTSSKLSNDILKPDIIAPGVHLLGAWTANGKSSNAQFLMVSGTSMATPILAGVSALIIQVHPDWSPAQVKSAMLTTAYTTTNQGHAITESDGTTAVTPWDIGSGHIDCTRVLDPGLTYDISYNDYVSFLRARDPRKTRKAFRGSGFKTLPSYQLNYPNIVVSFLRKSKVVVKRTVTNVGGADGVYTATVAAPSNAAVTVSPASLSVKAGGTASFTVTFTVKSRSKVFVWGSLTWADGKGHSVRSVLGLQAIY